MKYHWMVHDKVTRKLLLIVRAKAFFNARKDAALQLGVPAEAIELTPIANSDIAEPVAIFTSNEAVMDDGHRGTKRES